ncbi:MAG: dTMP kinase [Mycoplasma sp.]
MQKALFISFEGPDGSGKSTIAKLFHNYLLEKNVPTILTREPGGLNCLVAETIRNLVLEHKNFNILPTTEALLFAASRAQHVEEIIMPSINNGVTVVCDRFIDSSLAYQGYARDLGFENIYNINIFATKGLLPDVTFFIDVSAQVGMARIKNGMRDTNRIDNESIETHNKAYNGYQELIKKFKDRFIVIDGNQSIEKVLKDVILKYEELGSN